MKQSIIGMMGVAMLAALSGCSGGPLDESELETRGENLTAAPLETAPSTPAARFNMASCVINDPSDGIDKMLVGFGESAAGTEENDVFLYNPETDAWSVQSNALGGGLMPDRTQAKLVPVNGQDKCLLIGGLDNAGAVVSTVHEYDLSTNTWTAKTAMPTTRVAFEASPCGNGDTIIVVGGTDNAGNELDRVDTYDLSANAWTAATTLRDQRANFALASSDSTFQEFIVAGGQDGAAELDSVELISVNSACGTPARVVANNSGVDIAIDTRKDLVVFNDGTSGASDDFIVSAGDDSGVLEADSYRVTVTNYATGQSTRSAALSPALATPRTQAIAVPFRATAGRFAIIGGDPAGATSSSAVQPYNPATNAFSGELTMSAARKFASGQFLPSAGFALVVGGVDAAGTVLSSAETL